MNSYIVNATLTVPAWIEVSGDYEAQALENAREARPADFEIDMGAAEVEFNVDPVVSELPF